MKFDKTNRILKIITIFSPSKILFGDQFKTNEIVGTCGTDGGHVYTGFWWGKTEGKRTLSVHRFRWEDNIKVDLIETE
jgi:hypothetical protein